MLVKVRSYMVSGHIETSNISRYIFGRLLDVIIVTMQNAKDIQVLLYQVMFFSLLSQLPVDLVIMRLRKLVSLIFSYYNFTCGFAINLIHCTRVQKPYMEDHVIRLMNLISSICDLLKMISMRMS